MNLLIPQNLIDKFLKSKYKDEEFSVAIKPGEPVDIDWKKLFKDRTKIRFVAVKDTPGSDKFFKNIDKLYNIYDIFDGKDIIPATQNEYDVELAKVFIEEEAEKLSQDMLPEFEKEVVVFDKESDEPESNVSDEVEDDEHFKVTSNEGSAEIRSNVNAIAKATEALAKGYDGAAIGDDDNPLIEEIHGIQIPDAPIVGEDYLDVVENIEKKTAEVKKKAAQKAKKEAQKQAKEEEAKAKANDPKFQLYVVSLESALNRSTASQREKIASELVNVKDKGEVEGILKKYLKRNVTKKELDFILSLL